MYIWDDSGIVRAVASLVASFSVLSSSFRSPINEISLSTDSFRQPPSEVVDLIDPLVGTGGDEPNKSGGMIPTTAPPFAMTRWTAQTRQNFVSSTSYNVTDPRIHGFQGTHQPAIWMGESGQVVVQAGLGTVTPAFQDRGLAFSHDDEVTFPSYYRVNMSAGQGGRIIGEHSSSSRVGHIRYTFQNTTLSPFVIVQSTRNTIITSDPSNVTAVLGGSAYINPFLREIAGSNPERQDSIIGPSSASSFAGYYVARFSEPFASYGTSNGRTLYRNTVSLEEGEDIAGWVTFVSHVQQVEVKIGTSFISIDQARRNLEREIGKTWRLEDTAQACRQEWKSALETVTLTGTDADREDKKWKKIFYTSFWHSLQYPYEVSEEGRYYSGYDDSVHTGISYSGYSIWDTFRAAWPWQILFVPERISGMINSMLQDYEQGGWLPMWKNVVETNIMIGTHADSLIATAMVRNMTCFNQTLAYEAIKKNADVPPVNDTTTQYADREEHTDYEVRAGLTLYKKKGFVAHDQHTEAGSRTLAYAYDDYAVSVVASLMNQSSDAEFYADRSLNYKRIYNHQTGFMEARLENGSWAGPDAGWTEGDKWAYTFDVLHDMNGLIKLKKGSEKFAAFLDEHFNGGHNDHTNEPSHHMPYLYSIARFPSKSAERVHQVALLERNYGLGPEGLLGNEDCGQMSAWFLFSSFGFYPVNPASTEYIVGSPLFSNISISLPDPHDTSSPRIKLNILAPGAPYKKFIRSLTINGKTVDQPVIHHQDILQGGVFEFEMSESPTDWGTI